MVLEFSADQSGNSFTGYYYLFSFTAAIVSPITYDAIQNYFKTEGLLFFSVICFTLALISMVFVKHGDSEEIINA